MKPTYPDPQLPVSHPEPVAYDKDGRPLYAHPPQQTPPHFETAQSTDGYATPHQAAAPVSGSADTPPRPQVVYLARPHEPIKPHLSEEVKKKHEDSKQLFPYLNLSDGEYVISAIRRHPVGLIGIWSIVIMLVVILLGSIPFVTSAAAGFTLVSGSSMTMLVLMLCMAAVLVFFLGVIATVVYNANRFFLTNESVIQHIQHSLFSKKEQTISLANIEDASFRQHGILQHLVGFGSLRLSTEGDETTYRFNLVANPQQQIMLLNNAVEAFKNGRPFGDNDEP